MPNPSDAIDRELAARALEKRKRGEQPTRDELAALRRFEKAREEEARWRHYRSIPQKHWRAMSGRQTKVLHEQAATYGIPFGDAVIDLPAVVKALHDFLAKNGRKLTAPDTDDPLLAGSNSPYLEEYRREKAIEARLKRMILERQYVPRASTHLVLSQAAMILRGAGERLHRQFGEEAARMLGEALDDVQRLIDNTFADDPQLSPDDPPTDGTPGTHLVRPDQPTAEASDA